MIWLDSTAPSVRSAVESGGWGRAPHTEHGHPVPTSPTIDTIADALAQASGLLTSLTGGAIHPAGTCDEEFLATPLASRLSPTFTPLREVTMARRWIDGQVVIDPVSVWGVVGNGVVRQQVRPYDGLDSVQYDSTFLGGYLPLLCASAPAAEVVLLTYNFGSTITASARAAVIALAHDIYLDTQDCEECGLPQRTTTVIREGLTMQMGASVDASGAIVSATGLPSVDLWLKSVNPYRSIARPGVFTPDAPPPVVRQVRNARPAFAWNGAGAIS